MTLSVQPEEEVLRICKLPGCSICKPKPDTAIAFVPVVKRPSRPLRSPSQLYFIQIGWTGVIKIGISRALKARLAALQTGHDKQLRLLKAIPGGAAEEAELHEMFVEERVRGEWFKPSKRLLDFIEGLGK